MGKSLFGPTLDELKDPDSIPSDVREEAKRLEKADPLHPHNVYNLSWRRHDGKIPHLVLPKELTGVDANIVVLSGRHFPTGSHKVGPAYSILREYLLVDDADQENHTLIFPSTGNFGIGGAWVGPRMGFRSTVVLPEEMSAERFEKIRAYGADVIATPGCESNVKEIYDKVNELKRDPQNKILNQFAEFGNYRFHYHVTGHAAAEVTQSLGNQKVAAFVSAMGSAGTIAAGDFLKQRFGNTAIVGVEPIQCPTLYNVGFGGHRIEGIGDKHVTWIHNVGNMDLLVCIDDIATLRGLQLLQDGGEVLMEALGLNEETIKSFSGVFGMSGICNVLAAIKTAKFYGLGKDDNVLTLATDGFDRYPSVMAELDKVEGAMDREKALRRIELFHRTSLDYILEGSREVQRRWHNQKYFTWVEQQGKSVEDLNALFDSDFWIGEHEKIAGLDKAWANARNG